MQAFIQTEKYNDNVGQSSSSINLIKKEGETNTQFHKIKAMVGMLDISSLLFIWFLMLIEVCDHQFSHPYNILFILVS